MENKRGFNTAAAYYHSQTPSLAAEYRQKLEKVWTGDSMAKLAEEGDKLVQSGVEMIKKFPEVVNV